MSCNHYITCRQCGAEVHKGAPPQPGQDDSSFICETCGARGRYLVPPSTPYTWPRRGFWARLADLLR